MLAHEITESTLQVLALSEAVGTEVDHVYERLADDTLVFTGTAELRYGKSGAATDALVLADATRLHHTHWRAAGDTLGFTENGARGPIAYDRRVGDTLTFPDGNIPVGPPAIIDGRVVVITRQAAQIVRAARSVTLLSSLTFAGTN